MNIAGNVKNGSPSPRLNCVLPIILSVSHRLRPSETYSAKTCRSTYVKSSICSPLRAGLLVLALAATTSLHSQSANSSEDLVASLESLTVNLPADSLPDEPLPQASSQSSSTSAPQPPASTEDEKKKKEVEQRQQAEEQLKLQQKQRMVGIIPNFNTVLNGSVVPPLSASQKIRAAWRSAIDPYQFV